MSTLYLLNRWLLATGYLLIVLFAMKLRESLFVKVFTLNTKFNFWSKELKRRLHEHTKTWPELPLTSLCAVICRLQKQIAKSSKTINQDAK